MAHRAQAGIIDLSHVIEHGMTTYRGLPGPQMCDFWKREDTAGKYEDGATFQIGRVDMVGNTGTYVDCPFHRFADGKDFVSLPIEGLADLPGIVVRRPYDQFLSTDESDFAGLDVSGKAVLIHTGWDAHWRTELYGDNHPFLTRAAAEWLVAHGAALVGIDSYNIDDTRSTARPVHTALLGADIPICEHMTGLDKLPDSGFRFTAAPPKIVGMGSFPVRAYALLAP